MQPPETDPITDPLSQMAMIEPTGRGDEPHVRKTVANRARCPLRRQTKRVRSTETSTFSILNERRLQVPLGFEQGRLEREISQSFAGQFKDCSGHSGCYRWQANFAHATRLTAGLQNLDVHTWCLVHA